MRLRHRLAAGIAGVALVAALAASADAQTRHYPAFYGRDFHHFTPHERTIWIGGHWVHGWHDSRYAWWWLAGGSWYFYPEPIYPYPTYVPPAIVLQQPPPTPAGLPPAQHWYYCDKPRGYYPYVASCNGPWRQVPVTPSGPIQ